jgi:hypothetical protein
MSMFTISLYLICSSILLVNSSMRTCCESGPCYKIVFSLPIELMELEVLQNGRAMAVVIHSIRLTFLCILWWLWQVPALKRFPAPFTLMSLSSLVGTPMFAATAVFRVGLDPSEWIFPPGPDLIAAIYAVRFSCFKFVFS